MKNKLFFVLLIFFFMIYNVSSFSIEQNGNCNCHNCTDCEFALNDSFCYNIITLNNHMNAAENCIYGRYLVNLESKTINCNFHNITGSENYSGIYLYENNNIKIKNCITNSLSIYQSNNLLLENNIFFQNGIKVLGSSNSQIKNNTFYNTTYALYLQYLNNSNIFNNYFLNNSNSIFLVEESHNNVFSYNNINNSDYKGIIINNYNSNNQLKNNIICNSGEYDIYNDGIISGENNKCDTSYQFADRGEDYGCSEDCIYQECFCDSCNDCELKLNQTACKSVILINDIISDYVCINGSDIQNFTNKIFDCDHNKIKINESGLSQFGILLDTNNGVEIRNCDISYYNISINISDSDNIIIADNVLHNNRISLNIYDSDNIFLESNNIQNNTGNAIFVNESIVFVFDNYIYNTDYEAIKIYNSENSEVVGNEIIYNRGGLYLGSSSHYTKIYQNIICLNKDKNSDYFDIENHGNYSYGDRNMCDYTFLYDDLTASNCFFGCSDEYMSIEYYVNITEEELYNISVGGNIEDAITDVLGKSGIKGGFSGIIFVLIIKIGIDLLLIMKKFNFVGILIVNIFMLIFFALIGLISFWVVFIIFFLSLGLLILSKR